MIYLILLRMCQKSLFRRSRMTPQGAELVERVELELTASVSTRTMTIGVKVRWELNGDVVCPWTFRGPTVPLCL